MGTTRDKGIREVGPRRWEVRVYAGKDPDGKSIIVSRGCTGGLRDAQRLRKQLTAEIAQGKHGAKAGTFGDLLDAWLTNGKQGRSATTLEKYRYAIESTIRPALGDKMLDRLTAEDLDRFYAKLTADGVSPAMIKAHHRIISAALIQGEKWGRVPVSVARNASPPRVPVKEWTIPSPERVRDLINAAAGSRTPELATMITISALTGLRRGELCGLQWGDIDWQLPGIHVRRAVFQTSQGNWGTKDTKTHQVRHLVLGDLAMDSLAGRCHRALEIAQAAEIALADHGFVFSDVIDCSRPIMPDTLTNRFRALCKSMEEARPNGKPWPYRLHDLRHYAASELIRAGFSPRTVADRLGHADPAMTLRVYTHDTEDQAIAAAAALESGLAG